MAGRPDAQRVVDACRSWTWVPEDARTLETPEFLLVRYPDWFEHRLELVRFTPCRGVAEVLDEVLEQARGLDAPVLRAWARLDAPPELDDRLRAVGEPDEAVDVLALDLGGGVPDLDPAEDVELRWQTDVPTTLDSHAVASEVFGGAVPPERRLAEIAERDAADVAAGRGGGLVAYVDGTPAGSAGLTLADDVARLWGGAVRTSFRGRGVYRALLAARLHYAVRHGATLALVKGVVETSGPILRRAGFTRFGQERSYLVAL